MEMISFYDITHAVLILLRASWEGFARSLGVISFLAHRITKYNSSHNTHNTNNLIHSIHNTNHCKPKTTMQFPLFSILCLLALPFTTGSSLRGGASRQLESSVLCRMVTLESMQEDDDMVSVEKIPGCIPIVDGVESDDIVPLSALPADIAQAHDAQLEDGTLFIQITNAALVGDNDLAYSSTSEFIVVQNRRHLEIEHERRLKKVVNGTMTVAVVRISTLDATPTVSTQDLQALFDTDAINFGTQYDKCSNGKLKFVRSSAGDQGVINIQVQQPVADFGTKGGGRLVTAAQKALKAQLNIPKVSGIADRVIMCLPPGMGNWVASAGMFHWRAQFNNEWCLSLTATMHELGHTVRFFSQCGAGGVS